MIVTTRKFHCRRVVVICSIALATLSVTHLLVEANQESTSNNDQVIANHKMDSEETRVDEKPQLPVGGRRQSRQYDSTMSASNGAGFAAISADGSAYVSGQTPVSGSANYASGSVSSGVGNNYANEMSGAYHSSVYQDPLSLMSRAYTPPQVNPIGSVYGHSMVGYPPVPPSYNPISSMFTPNPSGGLLSSSIFPLMGSKGFEVSEIICTAIAVAVGAVIVGAPFILLYLFFMNQMNGNGPSAIGPSGGAISLTGPTSSTTVNGRKKRNTSLPEALFKQLSPLVNSEQVASTFKALMSSIAKYQV